MNCLECKTVSGKRCIFPFQYKGLAHRSCTRANSQRSWCATEVETRGGEVVRNKWEDCQPDCPMEDPGTGKIRNKILNMSHNHMVILKTY